MQEQNKNVEHEKGDDEREIEPSLARHDTPDRHDKRSVTFARKRIRALRSSMPNQEAMARTSIATMINPIPKVTIQFIMGMGKPNIVLLLHSAHFDDGKSQEFTAENLRHAHTFEVR